MSQKVVSVEARRIYIEPGYMWSRGAKNVKLEEQEFIPNRVFTCDIGVYSESQLLPSHCQNDSGKFGENIKSVCCINDNILITLGEQEVPVN